MSDKMREALKLADAVLSGANMNMAVVKRKISEALAEQPAQGDEPNRGQLKPHDGGSIAPGYTAPPAPSVSVPIAPPAAFAEWLRGNMPPDTIISDPDWWAMAIWSAARRAINAAPVASGGKPTAPEPPRCTP